MFLECPLFRNASAKYGCLHSQIKVSGDITVLGLIGAAVAIHGANSSC
jgi:hypothetical protein